MIKMYYGDVLQSKARIICHQVNCCGVMGAGLAYQIKKKYPDVYNEYYKLCQTTYKGKLLGIVQMVGIENGNQCIANCFGQLDPGPNTNYDALENSLYYIRNIVPKGYTIAIPYKIGCGIGKGNWEEVFNIIKNVFNTYEGEVQIWNIEDVPPQN